MATVVPDEGLEWFSERAVGEANGETAYIVAVGDGTGTVSSGNTSLSSELYRANDGDSNCTVEATASTGEIVAKITVSGTELNNLPQDITEFGLFASDGSTLLYREVRSAVTIQSGDRKTFQFTVTFID